MTLSRSVSTDRALAELVAYAQFRGCRVLEYEDATASFHVEQSFHDLKATDPRFAGRRQAADINHDGTGDAAEFAFLLDTIYPYARERGIAVTFPAASEGHGVAGHSIDDGLHLHADRGEWSNVGQGAEKLPGTGNDRGLAEPEVRAVQRTLGLTPDGIYGLDTLTAVAAEQRRLRVTDDGLWGPRTKAARDRAGPHVASRSAPRRPPAAWKDLHTGSVGPGVKSLQQLLNRDFPAYSHLVADGHYGERTRSVVQEFQRRSHLGVDGVVDQDTATALGFDL